MGNDRELRPQGESNTELSAAVGALALSLLLYYLLRIFHISDVLAPMIAVGAVPVVLSIVRSVLVRRSSADREIREAMTGAPIINPFLVCVVAATSLEFVEQFLSFTFGAVSGTTSRVLIDNSTEVAKYFETHNLAEVALAAESLYVSIFLFLFTWPIMQMAGHYFRKRAILWIITTLVLFGILNMGVLSVALVATPGLLPTGFRANLSWITTILDQARTVLILILPALFGYFVARRRQPSFLLRRAFRRLNRDDREAALDLLLDRQSGRSAA
jgi:hypothetical protein